MKFPIRIMTILIMSVVIFAFGLNLSVVFPELSEHDYISPEKGAIAMTTKIYFVYDNALRSENRKIEVVNNDYEKAVIDAIIDGPKNVRYESIFDYNTNVISVEYINNTCYLNLSSDILTSDVWKSDRLDLYLWAVVNSLTEIKRVFDVQFLIDGEYIDDVVLGYNLHDPLPRMESLNYLKERTPSDAVVEFVDYINSSRIDLAYDLLTDNTKLVYDFNDFVKYVDSFSTETSGFTRDMYFTKTYSDKWIIYLKFIKNSDSNDFQLHFYKKWTVVEVEGKYKIDLLKN